MLNKAEGLVPSALLFYTCPLQCLFFLLKPPRRRDSGFPGEILPGGHPRKIRGDRRHRITGHQKKGTDHGHDHGARADTCRYRPLPGFMVLDGKNRNLPCPGHAHEFDRARRKYKAPMPDVADPAFKREFESIMKLFRPLPEKRKAPVFDNFLEVRGMRMARVLMMLLLALLLGCATTPPEDHSTIKRISQVPGMAQAALESVEKMMSVAVSGFGYPCPAVTAIYVDDPEGGVLIATCFDGKTDTYYRYVQSKDGEWYSVTPTENPGAISLEERLAEIICGRGFQCSEVTEVLFTDGGGAAQATCAEGKYRVVKDNAGQYTVSPW